MAIAGNRGKAGIADQGGWSDAWMWGIGASGGAGRRTEAGARASLVPGSGSGSAALPLRSPFILGEVCLRRLLDTLSRADAKVESCRNSSVAIAMLPLLSLQLPDARRRRRRLRWGRDATADDARVVGMATVLDVAVQKVRGEEEEERVWSLGLAVRTSRRTVKLVLLRHRGTGKREGAVIRAWMGEMLMLQSVSQCERREQRRVSEERERERSRSLQQRELERE